MLIISDPTFHYPTSTGALHQELKFTETFLSSALQECTSGEALRYCVEETLRSVRRALAEQAARDKAQEARRAHDAPALMAAE